MGVLLLVLAGILLALYLHRIGVPEPFKAMVVSALLDRGMTIEFERLRLHWYRGLVADRVRGRETGSPEAPHVEFRELVLDLDWAALLRRQIELRGLGFQGGRLVAPLQLTNEPPEELVVEVPDARLRFGADDLWSLDELTARAAGVSFSVHGSVTNGSALPRVLLAALRPSTPPNRPSGRWRTQLRTVKHQLASLRFSEPPTLRLAFTGDGRELGSFRGEVRAVAGGVWTPWGELRHVSLLTRSSAVGADDRQPRMELRLEASDATTRWGTLENVRAHALISPPFAQRLPERVDWGLRAATLRTTAFSFREAELEAVSVRRRDRGDRGETEFTLHAGGVQSRWGDGGDFRVRGWVGHTLSNAVPESFAGQVEVASLRAGRVGIERAQAEIALSSSASPPDAGDPALGFWRSLAGIRGGFGVQAQGVTTPRVELDSISFGGEWGFPALRLTNLVADLCGGQLTMARAEADVLTRGSSAQLSVDFDVQRLTNALPAAALAWLAQFEYATPPHAEATVRAVLPPWTGGGTTSALDLRRSLDLRVKLEGSAVAFKGLAASRAGATLTISNDVLRLRELRLERPEGEAELSYDLDLTRRDFRWRVRSALDAHAAADVVDPVLPEILGLFEFTAPPRVTGEIWGNWNPPKVVDFALQLETEEFRFRGEPFLGLEGELHKRGVQLAATGVTIRHATGEVGSAAAGYDVVNRVVTLTNACARMDPLVAARCIGSEFAGLLAPYRFVGAQAVEANGRVEVGGKTADSDLTIAVEGDAFQYWRFNTRKLAAVVRWANDRVSVTNIACEFYGGRLSGEFILDLPPGSEPRFQFQARGTDFDLQGLLRDAVQATNQIAGTVTGTLVVTNALVNDWTSWQGYGQARMRDGMLWDLPIFGVLSRVMNLVVPGTGNSRATAAQGSYTITRSVIHTDNLEIDAGLARLQYAGTVDFQGNVEARVMAEVLRATPIVGPLISLVFSPASKALEFKVTGTLGEPVLKPLYVPGFLLPFLNPVGAVQDLFTPKPNGPGASRQPK